MIEPAQAVIAVVFYAGNLYALLRKPTVRIITPKHRKYIPREIKVHIYVFSKVVAGHSCYVSAETFELVFSYHSISKVKAAKPRVAQAWVKVMEVVTIATTPVPTAKM
jgi:hypothetical protein